MEKIHIIKSLYKHTIYNFSNKRQHKRAVKTTTVKHILLNKNKVA